MQQPEIIDRALAEGIADDADAGIVAAAAFRAVDLLLNEIRPLVGGQATRALYSRSLHLARSSFRRPDLAEPETRSDLASLQHDLAGRAPVDARLAARALLTSFVDLLVSLIGRPLANRILESAWGTPTAKHPAEDDS